jgi:hypothetical protein
MWPIARIDPARCFASAARAKTLSVGGTGRSLAEVRRKRQFVVVIDDLSASFGVGLRPSLLGEIPGQASAIRVTPRLMASASTGG